MTDEVLTTDKVPKEPWQMTLYHGTKAKFSKFILSYHDTGAGDLGIEGIYFTPDEELARMFSQGGDVIRAKVTVRKPYHINIEDLIEWGEGEVVPKLSKREGDKLVSELKSEGYDSIIIDPATPQQEDVYGLQGEFDDPQYILFSPNQARIIKRTEYKEAWEHPLNKYVTAELKFNHYSSRSWADSFAREHKRKVVKALSAGKPVPAEVLADYPDLAKAVKPPAPRKIQAVRKRLRELREERSPHRPSVSSSRRKRR